MSSATTTPVQVAPAPEAPASGASPAGAGASPQDPGASVAASEPAGTPAGTDPVPAAPAADATTAAPATAAAPASTASTTASGVGFPLKTGTTAQVGRPVGHAAPPQADAGSIGGAIFSLVLVIGLIFGLGWLARRMPGMQRGASNAQLRVVASLALGPRERAVVVDVGGAQLLLGVGQGGVRTLHVLEQPLPVAEASGTLPSPFAQVLAQHFGRKP